MIVFLNGKFVPEAQATVSVFDRSFLYGDGLFETLRVFKGKPFRWMEHIDRLTRGADFLKIQIRFTADELHQNALQLITQNQMPEALLRISLSRGVGLRGYSPRGADQPTLVMTLASAPEMKSGEPPQWRAITASRRLPAEEPLAEFKTCNKLAQVLARAEAEGLGADEALLLNTCGEVVEAASSNLFWIEQDCVCTPALSSGVLAGVTRAVIFELCKKSGLPTRESSITPEKLYAVQGVFLSLSSSGIIEVISFDGKILNRSPLTQKLYAAYGKMIAEMS